MDIGEWIDYGLEHGYCTPPVCNTHDSVPSTEAEDIEWEDGFDPCVHVMRVLESPDMRDELERNSPQNG
jgi:hypothetical protein